MSDKKIFGLLDAVKERWEYPVDHLVGGDVAHLVESGGCQLSDSAVPMTDFVVQQVTCKRLAHLEPAT